MEEINIRMANMADFPLITEIDLDFDSEFVWKSQMIDDLDAYSISIQKIKLPKVIHVPFQGVTEDAVEAMIKRQEVICAHYDNQIVGFLRLEQDDNTSRILLKTGGVKPEYRRKGICSAMMNVVEATAVENQISRIVCTVQAKNDSAIQFLAAHHFSYCGYQEFYFPNLEIALFFAKNIR